jgi:hypothetical protein
MADAGGLSLPVVATASFPAPTAAGGDTVAAGAVAEGGASASAPPRSRSMGHANISFRINPGGGTVEESPYDVSSTVEDVKNLLASHFHVEPYHVVIRFAGEPT